MQQRKEPLPDRIYRAFLRMLPFDFRLEFGPEMEEVFREQRAYAAREKGRIGLLHLWWETLAGLFRTAPQEHLSMLRQDVRYAGRMMRNNLGYTIAATLTLALGIGVNTAIFSVTNAVLLRPLPYREGNRIMVLRQQARKAGLKDIGFSVQEMNDYRAQSGSLLDMVEYHSMAFTLFTRDEAQRVRAGVVSPGFFEMFGVRPLLGRTFTASDDDPGAPAVLMLSYEYWKQRQGGDPDIVGKVFKMNDRPHTVIGVLPPVPQYPDENDVYMPTSACPYRASKGAKLNREARLLNLFARLKPGGTPDVAAADLSVIAKRLETQYPKVYERNAGFTATAAPLQQELTERARPALLVLIAAAAFVLLIACANVANLMLSRMARRERELVVRFALGAGKSRLLRQLVTESLIMGLLAAALGWLFASESLSLLVKFVERLSPRAREIQIDSSMLLFALAAAVLTSVVFGSLSALYSRDDLAGSLKDGSGGSTGRRRQRLRSALIVCQVAFSFVLLDGAGLMLRSLVKLQNVDAGFVPQRVLAARVMLNWSKYRDMGQIRDAADRMLTKVRQEPGIVSAAVSSGFPLQNTIEPSLGPIQIQGRVPAPGEPPALSSFRVVTPTYFSTLGIPLLRGRAFNDQDKADAPLVAVINETFARRYWPGRDPIGQRIGFAGAMEEMHWRQIVGVVGDVREFGLHRDPSNEVYAPLAQNPQPGVILVKTAGDPLAVTRQVRRAILAIDPQTAIPTVETLEQVRSEALTQPRVMADLLAIFAALALLVAATGIGGILALTVSQRMREIGIRMAIGAKPGQVFRAILSQGMALVSAGLALGIAGAWAFTTWLDALLFQVGPHDPLTFVTVALLFAAAALAACYVPARRATKIDPLIALRQE